MTGHDCSVVKLKQVQSKKQPPPVVRKVWVPKKKVVPQGPTTLVTPMASQALTHSGADGGWRVATKKSKNKGIPVSTDNYFSALDEEATDEEGEGSEEEDVQVDEEDIPPDL